MHRWMFRRAGQAALVVLVGAASVSAQTKKNVHPRVLVMPQAHFGAPLREAAGGAVLVTTRKWDCSDGWCGAPGVEVSAMIGEGGWRVGGGLASIGVIWADALVTVTQTRAEPRRASPESTYVGVEGGFGFPVYGKGHSFLTVRPGIGVARRIDGAGPSAQHTTFTWNIGASLMLPTRWFARGG